MLSDAEIVFIRVIYKYFEKKNELECSHRPSQLCSPRSQEAFGKISEKV